MLGTKAQEILSLYEHDEKAAFDLLCNNYYLALLLFANKLIKDRDLSKDIVQDTLVDFWVKKQLTRINYDIDGYLFNAIRYKALDSIRSQDRKEGLLRSAYEEYKNMTILDNSKIEDYSILYRAIELLPEQRREIFKLVYFEGYKYQEAADRMGITVSTVHTQISRSLKFLREILTATSAEENSRL